MFNTRDSLNCSKYPLPSVTKHYIKTISMIITKSLLHMHGCTGHCFFALLVGRGEIQRRKEEATRTCRRGETECS
jgi:hypothetical protein